jgi:hypothetical protein
MEISVRLTPRRRKQDPVLEINQGTKAFHGLRLQTFRLYSQGAQSVS